LRESDVSEQKQNATLQSTAIVFRNGLFCFSKAHNTAVAEKINRDWLQAMTPALLASDSLQEDRLPDCAQTAHGCVWC
jgi:hypothetical protein